MDVQNKVVNLVPGVGGVQTYNCSQGDIGRTLEFTIINGSSVYSIPSDATVTVAGTKPSGMGFSEVCTITTDGTAEVNTTEAMTQEPGRIWSELRIVDADGANIGTANFMLAVEKSPHDASVTDGTIAEAKTILERAEDAVTECEAIAEGISTEGLSAEGASNGQVPTADGSGSWSWADQQGGGGGGVTVDDAMSTTSTNPVQNKVITAQLRSKASLSDIPTAVSQLTNDAGYITDPGVNADLQSGGQYLDLTVPDGSTYTLATDAAMQAAYTQVTGMLAAKADKTVATTTADGLMSAADKATLDAVAADYSAALTALGVV